MSEEPKSLAEHLGLAYEERVAIAQTSWCDFLTNYDEATEEADRAHLQRLDEWQKKYEGAPFLDEIREEGVEETAQKCEEIRIKTYQQMLEILNQALGSDAVAEARERVRRERS